MTETTSTAPNGEQFPLPTQQDEAAELLRLQAENFENLLITVTPAKAGVQNALK